jgi:hypothetical protein
MPGGPWQPEIAMQVMPAMSRHSRRVRTWVQAIREHLGGSRRSAGPITDRDALAAFFDTRSSHMAQTSLYGYLRTRAGMRYPELFDDDPFVASINIAKWNVWVACLSDLAVYSGGLLARNGDADAAGAAVSRIVERLIEKVGVPAEAGADYPEQVARLRARLAGCDWAAVSDDETPFAESPDALVRWAPVIDELKALDAGIVRNSVRFRWQEVRRELRTCLDAGAVLRSDPGARADAV